MNKTTHIGRTPQAATASPQQPPQPRIDVPALVRAEIAAGRHAPIEQWRCLCEGCREQVPAIYHITLDRRALCIICAVANGGMTVSDYRWTVRYLQRRVAAAPPLLVVNIEGKGGSVEVVEVEEIVGESRCIYDAGKRRIGVSPSLAAALQAMASARAPPEEILQRLRSLKIVTLTV